MLYMSNSTQKLVLALDTAGDAIALAVGRISDEEYSFDRDHAHSIDVVASGDRMARREANVQLVPAIEELFVNNKLAKEDIACVVCGRGPGSFTGVRIAVATAKGLAAGLGVPLCGVATPDALAWQCWNDGIRGNIAVLLDAMRGEVYPARYVLDESGARRKDSLTVIKADALVEKWNTYQNELILTGDALYKYGDVFSDFTWLSEQHWRPKGSGLLRAFENEVAHLNFDTCNHVAIAQSIAALLPVYTRLSDAEENERKRLASGGAIAQGALTEVPASGVAWTSQGDEGVFRPASKHDIPAMVALEHSVYAQASSLLSGECWTAEMYEAEFAQLDRSWWVCYVKDAFAGFVGGQLINGEMHVLDVVVSEVYRRQGLAKELLLRLARDAQDLGATKLTLEVRASNTSAQLLYSSLGLVEIGRRKDYYSPQSKGAAREDAVIMTGSVEDALGAEGKKTLAHAASNALVDTHETAITLSEEKPPLILAIESSCDETAAALIDGEGRLLTNRVASQTDFHARFGGVVPEIASRKHTEAIYPVVMDALGGRAWQDIDAVAVTYAPGLIGALVVGVAFAKGLCWATGLPLIRVNHLEGHIYANRFIEDDCLRPLYRIDSSLLQPPFVIALLSGGNTMLVHVQDWGSYQVLGETLDDAIGEAYDKVAKALGLGYPGGPIIARLAAEGNPRAIDFPRALLHSHDYRFSFSGLKTAVLTVIREQEALGTLNAADIAASFEQAVIEVQVAKARNACESLGVSTFCIGGGVASNTALRNAYKATLEARGIKVLFPPQLACTDNAAMIAAVALDRFKQSTFSSLATDAIAHADLEDEY